MLLQYCAFLFQAHINMNQLYKYICSLHLEPSCHLPSYPTALGCHRVLCLAPCIIQLIPTIYFTYGNVYGAMLPSHFILIVIKMLSRLQTLDSTSVTTYQILFWWINTNMQGHTHMQGNIHSRCLSTDTIQNEMYHFYIRMGIFML